MLGGRNKQTNKQTKSKSPKLHSILGPEVGRAPRRLSKGSNALHHTKDALAWVLGYFLRSVLSQLPPSQLRCQGLLWSISTSL